MRRNINYIICLLFFLSCTSSLSVGSLGSGNNKPDWITRQPTDNAFWYGVGIANLDMDDPRQAARQRAFSEIAEQLRVNIKSTFTDVMEQTNTDFTRYTKSVIEARVDASLEHVENVDSYQDKSRQYVLARLDKIEYFAKINQKKEEAASKARNLINKSISDMSANSLSNISLAIEAVSSFLDLFPKMKFPQNSGKEESIVIVAEKLIRDYNEQIELKFSPSTIEAMSFVNDEIKVGITAVNRQTRKKVSNVRVNVRLNDEPSDGFVLTDNNGKSDYQLDRLKASAGNHSLIFTLDYNTMMSEQALAVVKVVPKEYPLEISLRAPKIYFDGNVVNLDKKVNNSPIITTLKECFEDNYSSTFVEAKRKADIILRLNIQTEERAKRLGENYPYFVYATGSISLINNKTSEEVLNSTFKDSKGADFNSKEKAGLNALKKLSQNMNIDICN